MENSCMKLYHLKLLMKLMLLIIMTTTTMTMSHSEERHRVGGEYGWAENVNFTEWANQERFYVHDWLLFWFDKHRHNVLEVNKTNYDNCRDKEFITNITKGGRDVFELKEARIYYFLSGGGYCWGGMKLAITVQQVPPPPAPAPASSKSAFPPAATRPITLILAFLIALLWSN